MLWGVVKKMSSSHHWLVIQFLTTEGELPRRLCAVK